MKRRTLLALASICTAALVAGPAAAQAFPARPVKVIVPFAPGGNLDVTARLIGEAMARELGQPFVIENRAGAGGALGSDAVAKSPPDGYTLVAGTTGTSIVSPLLIPNPPYSLASFTPVGMMAVTPLILEVPAASPHADFRAWLAHARANPGKVSIAHSGNGTTNHIAILQLRQALKVDLNVIPFKGSGPAIVALVGSQVDSMVDQTSSSLPQIKGGRLRALAALGKNRVVDLPDVPSLTDLGITNFEGVTPSGLFAPAETPPAVIATLAQALAKALADPAVRKRLQELGSEVRPMDPAQFTAFMRSEETKLKALAASGLLKGE